MSRVSEACVPVRLSAADKDLLTFQNKQGSEFVWLHYARVPYVVDGGHDRARIHRTFSRRATKKYSRRRILLEFLEQRTQQAVPRPRCGEAKFAVLHGIQGLHFCAQIFALKQRCCDGPSKLKSYAVGIVSILYLDRACFTIHHSLDTCTVVAGMQ